MGDVYDRYLRLRLLDVILKRNKSSGAASTAVPMEKAQHVSGPEYRVQASESESWYSVDLAVGMCSCPAGDTGAVCKHQLAASQFSAVKLPQMFGCSPDDKCLLSKIVYGNKSSYDVSFFSNLGHETQQSNGSEQADGGEQAEGSEEADGGEQTGRGEQASNGKQADDGEQASSGEQAGSSEQTDDGMQATVGEQAAWAKETASFEHKIIECTNMLSEKLASCKSEQTERALVIFNQRLRSVGNIAQLCSFLTTAGFSVYKTTGALKRRIACQPTSISRRQHDQPRCKSVLLRGRIVKRKRNLAANINLNQPNAKIH